MATIQERLRRLRTGETPGTAASPSGGPENETGERRAAQSGGLTVTERLAKMRQDGEEISRQREAKEQQIQQARVDLLLPCHHSCPSAPTISPKTWRMPKPCGQASCRGKNTRPCPAPPTRAAGPRFITQNNP